jgi:hypothetical protein
METEFRDQVRSQTEFGNEGTENEETERELVCGSVSSFRTSQRSCSLL